jgi:ATP-dependent helicase/nuclease subunit A
VTSPSHHSPHHPPHRVLLASAGTGKTYRLTGHFLALLFRGVPPERILATTFTRKAAGEILDRVLGRLVEATGDEEERNRLSEEIGGRKIGAEECAGLLATLTRHLDHFQVRTLDSFFAHVARIFALDLSLPTEWRIADDREAEELEGETVGRALAEAGAVERLELLRNLQKEAASRSVHEALLSVVRQARHVFLESEEEAWKRVQPGPQLDEGEVVELRARLEALELPQTKAKPPRPRKSWEKARGRAVDFLAKESWDDFLGLTFVQRALDESPIFDRAEISEEYCALLRPLADHAIQCLIARIARQNAATWSFLLRFDRSWRTIQRERGALRFEDIPAAIAPGGASGRRPIEERELDLWFRLDGRIDHLLLDEFQDTAPLQYRVLAPLVDEVLADGTGERSLFCVGDVKQSIYGWRQAEPRLLQALSGRAELVSETMAKSYRSSAVVLGAVNQVFARIHENHAIAGDQHETTRRAARDWCEGIEEHTAARDLPGAVLLLEARPADEGEEKDAPVLELAVERVKRIVEAAPTATVGLLLRTKSRLPRLIYLLRREGIRASGEGGNPLTDSAAVLAFLSLLQLADHPSDSAAAFHVATSPLGAPLGLLTDPGEGIDPIAAHALARRVRARLAGEGYGSFCASIREEIVEKSERWSSWDRARFARLVELAHAFDERAGLRPAEFADQVRLTKVEDPSVAQVRVMTIHAAKGLEFDAVLLPQLNQQLQRHRDGILTDRPEAFGGVECASHNPKKIVLGSSPVLAALSAGSVERNFGEALSVLYVAMTRAARRLEMVVQGTASGALTYAALLREALGAGEPDEERVVWRHPESVEEWAAEGDAGSTPEPPLEVEPSEVEPLQLAPSSRARSLRSRSPSAEEGSGALRAGALLETGARGAMTRGTLLHRWLEELEWIEDFTASDEELLAIGRRIEPDISQRREALAELRRALEDPELRHALARPASGDHEVRREHVFSLLLPEECGEHGAPQLWNGAIDRFVLERRDGETVAAEVLDYKSDRVSEEELESRVAFYRPQLEAYRRVAAAITGLAPEAIRARLLFLSLGRIVDLDD